MSGTVLSTLHELSHQLLIIAPTGRIHIFIFRAKETDPENQNELLIVTRLNGNGARIQMWLRLGDKAICFSPKVQKLPLEDDMAEPTYCLPNIS